MGNWRSKTVKVTNTENEPAGKTPDEPAAQKETAELSNEPPPPTSASESPPANTDPATEVEKAGEEGGGKDGGEGEGGKDGEGEGGNDGEGEGEGEGGKDGGEGEEGKDGERETEPATEEGEEREEKSVSPSEPLPLQRVKQLRNDSEFSLHVGSTESLVGLVNQKRLNPGEFKKPIKFKKIQPTICTGDLALLYRRDQAIPHVAVFVNHIETDPLFPLLLVKGKTKPLPRDKFCPEKPRFIHPITATTRIFYGDYEKVAVHYLETDKTIEVQKAMAAIAAVEDIPFSQKEVAAMESAETDHQRSLLMSTFMAAYYYKELGGVQGNARWSDSRVFSGSSPSLWSSLYQTADGETGTNGSWRPTLPETARVSCTHTHTTRTHTLSLSLSLSLSLTHS